jgi:hypothetical protein
MLPILEKINEEGEYRPTIKEVRQWCCLLNSIVFEGKFPKFSNITVKSFYGQFAAVTPYINTKTNKRSCQLEMDISFRNFKFFITILAHEMIHAHQWIVKEIIPNHDRKTFFIWKTALALHGIELHVHYTRN